MSVYIFFLPTGNHGNRKKNLVFLIFFYFLFSTDRLCQNGSRKIRHPMNQPSVALVYMCHDVDSYNKNSLLNVYKVVLARTSEPKMTPQPILTRLCLKHHIIQTRATHIVWDMFRQWQHDNDENLLMFIMLSS